MIRRANETIFTCIYGARAPLECVWRSGVWAVCVQYVAPDRKARKSWQVIHVPTGCAASFNQPLAAAMAFARDLAKECKGMGAKAEWGCGETVARMRKYPTYRRVKVRHGFRPMEIVG